MISEMHCCCDCINRISVPTSYDCISWELVCKKRRKEVNRDGGLTDCPCFEEGGI